MPWPRPFASTREQVADSLAWLATAPEAASLKNGYVSKRRPQNHIKVAGDSISRGFGNEGYVPEVELLCR